MKFSKKIFPFLFVLLLSGLQTGFSQQPDTLFRNLDPIQIDAIYSTISPEQAPLSLFIESRTVVEINSEPALTMDDITATMPGIWVNDRENYALGERITIRGLGWRAAFGVRGIQVIMDGIPLTVADGQSMLNSVDPAFVRSIELIRGPASSFWGNSSGGVLYLSTFADPEHSPALRLRSSLGSYGLFKQDLQFSHAAGRHEISAYTSYITRDGYRDYSSSKVSRTGIRGSVNLNNKSRIEYMGAFVGMPQARHPSSLTREQALQDPTQANTAFAQNESGKEVYQAQAGINYHRDTSAGFLTLTGYGIHRDLNNPLPFGIISLQRWAGGVRGTLEKDFNRLNLKAGFDTKLQHDDRTEYENNGGSRGAVTVEQVENVTNQALFTTLDYTIGSLNILGGLRYDWITFSADTGAGDRVGNRTFHALNPSIGFSYLAGSHRLYTNFSTSFEAPTTTELVNRPGGGNGFNPGIGPEHTLGAEVGSRGSWGKLFSYDMAVYRMWINDLLFPYQLEANGPTYYRNQGKSTHTGLEASLTVTPGKAFHMNLLYNYTHALFAGGRTGDGFSLEDKQVPGIPDHRFNAEAGYSRDNMLLELGYRFVSSYYADNLNTAAVEAYSLVNAKISHLIHFKETGMTLQPYLNVNNIFNIRYTGSIVPNAFGGRYYEPAAGRNIQLGISLSLD